MKGDSGRIAITGANGFVARNLRKYLNTKHIEVVAIARKNFHSYKSEKKIISPNYSEKTLLLGLKGCDAMVHLVGIGNQTTNSDYLSTNVTLTKKLIQICKKKKIKKIIFNSGLGVSKKSTLSYFISKFHAEQEIVKSGLDYTIFRPSYIIGKDDLLTKNFKRQSKEGRIIIPGSGKYMIQPIFVEDAIKIITVAIFSKNFTNKILDLVGPKALSFEKFVKVYLQNKKLKFKKFNLEKLYFKAIHNPNSCYSVDDLNILIGSFVANHKNIEKLSGVKLTNFLNL